MSGSVFLLCCLLVFFFKQKTAYEMRISDWSSDVCSSDLRIGTIAAIYVVPTVADRILDRVVAGAAVDRVVAEAADQRIVRSEERRVGKECVSTCRSRVSRYD